MKKIYYIAGVVAILIVTILGVLATTDSGGSSHRGQVYNSSQSKYKF